MCCEGDSSKHGTDVDLFNPLDDPRVQAVSDILGCYFSFSEIVMHLISDNDCFSLWGMGGQNISETRILEFIGNQLQPRGAKPR